MLPRITHHPVSAAVTRPALALLVLALAVALATPAAFAKGSGSGSGSGGGGDQPIVIKTGTCSSSARWKLKLKEDDGQLEAEFEVDSNKRGQRWRVTLRNQGDMVFSGVETTAGASGSFSLERRIANRAGADRVKAVATNVRSGATCTGVASIDV